MNPHTPGPWFHGCEDDPSSGDVYLNDGSLIAEAFVNGDTETRVANARLIAAAPDLLEALESAVARQAYRPGEGPEWWDQSRAAIAKATGKSE